MRQAPRSSTCRSGSGTGFWSACLLLVWFAPQTAVAQALQFGGFLRLDKRFHVGGDSVTIADFYNRFRLEMTLPVGERVSAFTSVDVRFYDLPRIGRLADQEEIDRLFPTEFSLWEAYVEVYGFLFENLDLRIGKQRIAWGTADGLNHTDNLNPNDFSDLVNFTEKIPTWAAQASYYLGELSLTAVWVPSLTPILLPRNSASLFLDNENRTFVNRAELPSPQPQHGMMAFKLSRPVGNWDVSLSYFDGYDDVPILRKVEVRTGANGLPAGRLVFGYPQMRVLGFDFATELGGAGFWGEGALFFPEGVVATLDVDGRTEVFEEQLSDRPYFKFTLGGDYTFGGGVYVNAQWMRGFFTQRGRDALNDYFVFEVEKRWFREAIRTTLGLAWEVGDWSAPWRRAGYGVFPEISYTGLDNLEMTLGGFLVDGKPNTLFGSWKDADQVYAAVKVSF